MTSDGRRRTDLSTLEMYQLDEACIPINRAFGGPPYLVGSVERPGAHQRRDVDVRLILDDVEYDTLFGERPGLWMLLSMTLSVYLRDRTGLPIDFQVQRQTEANARYGDQPRNPLGMHRTFAAGGDATPARSIEP